MGKTRIDWCNYTCNCFWGCTKGCSYCAAKSMAKRFGRRIGEKRHYPKEIIEKMANFEPVFLADQLDNVYHIKKPSKIFMSFMGEPFAPEFEPHWLNNSEVWQAIEGNPHLTFIMLTKQPQNLIKYSPFPSNCWVGYSATNPDMFVRGLRYMSQVKATVKFVSLEPLLDWNNFIGYNAWELLDWIIIGAQTPRSEKTSPKWEWIQNIIEACDKSNIPIFLKENLGLPKYTCEGATPFYKKANGTMELRQEIPLVK